MKNSLWFQILMLKTPYGFELQLPENLVSKLELKDGEYSSRRSIVQYVYINLIG